MKKHEKNRIMSGSICYNKYLLGEFHLELKTAAILRYGFKLTVVDGKGKTRKEDVDRNVYLTGNLQGDKNSHIEAHWEDGLLSASISTSEDIYVIEPSWRILEPSVNHSLVVYRKSDVIWDTDSKVAGHRESFCDQHSRLNGDNELRQTDFEVSYESNGKSRVKRQVVEDLGSHNTCSLFIIEIINRVNGIYRRTKWPDDSSAMTGLGFEIAENFSREREFNSYCLAHLFTYQRFDRGVLGLAYISSSKKRTSGVHDVDGEKLSLNTGFSSCMNSEGQRVLSLEAALVTAHGHNWGSEHDPDTPSCAPSESNGGKYLMYQYSVSGFENNNQLFSQCSRQYIHKVLQSKGYDCFKEHSAFTFCGNGRGKCFNGKCVSYCKLKGLNSCICPKDSGHACHRCCQTDNGTDCKSQGDILPDGRPCFQGYCVKGVCEKQTPEVIQRFHSLIDQITSDKVVAFMKTNIVGTILIFSLLIWIPASCTFSYFDKKKEKKYRKLKTRSRSIILVTKKIKKQKQQQDIYIFHKSCSSDSKDNFVKNKFSVIAKNTYKNKFSLFSTMQFDKEHCHHHPHVMLMYVVIIIILKELCNSVGFDIQEITMVEFFIFFLLLLLLLFSSMIKSFYWAVLACATFMYGNFF
ncbi:hypothetical protein KUTeg_002678 [Tegillarca granosa]|uniref:Peptidase M12B domain-containing protein n=1 Tax=Tegillarca granosa TaxID=220873 RepID=A0ABQ9FWI2_TEGGR|nr:hypothetical protein KUTeg_002678 [Tegillarca granosa]